MSISQAAAALGLSDDALARRFGEGSFQRGRAYARQHRVGVLA